MGSLRDRKLTVLAVALGLYALQIRSESVYLERVGPPPLRFAIVAAATPATFAVPLAMTDDPTNTVASSEAQTNSVRTNSLALQDHPVPAQTNGNAGPLQSDLQNELPAPTPTTASASDLLVVSPQMLTELFKPGPGATNSDNALVLPAVGFTPPGARPSSQATYKAK